MNVNEFVSELAKELAWERCTLSPHVQHKYREYLTNKVDETLAEVDARDARFADSLKILLNTLDSQMRVGVVTAPVFASLTIMPDSLFERGKRPFILRNLLRLIEARQERRENPFSYADSTKREGSYCVLFDGDLPIPGVDRGGTKLTPVLDQEIQMATLHKLIAADAAIQEMSQVNTFATLNTDVIVFRFENEFPTVFSSGSFRLMPGLSLLCNSHLPSVTYHKMANAVVHEAIHGIIYRFETYGERLVPKANEQSGKVKSPWTGRLLNPTAFAQACFVWFGLYHFWKQREAEDVMSKQQFENARSGFLVDSFLETCRNASPILSAGVAAQIEDLAGLVRHCEN